MVRLNIAGLAMSAFGVILLFYFAIPYRVRTGGNQVTWQTENIDEDTVRAERKYRLLSYLGLSLVLAGALAQSISAWEG
jgi:hypothetical protein